MEGYPKCFWKERRYRCMEDTFNEDAINYSAIIEHEEKTRRRWLKHLVDSRVEAKLNEIDREIEWRRVKLRQLLDDEDAQYAREITIRRELEESVKQPQIEEVFDECEVKPTRYVIPGCRRDWEVQLRDMQKEQIKDLRDRRELDKNFDLMWYHAMMDNIQKQDELHRRADNERKLKMLELRKIYEQHIDRVRSNQSYIKAIERQTDTENNERISSELTEERKRELDDKKSKQEAFASELEREMTELKRRRSSNIEREKLLDLFLIENCRKEIAKEEMRQKELRRRLRLEQEIFLSNHKEETLRRLEMDLERDRAIENIARIKEIES